MKTLSSVFKICYERLIAGGKPKKVTLVTAMPRLLTVLNAFGKSGQHWDESLHSA